jgi:hypothetical protein
LIRCVLVLTFDSTKITDAIVVEVSFDTKDAEDETKGSDGWDAYTQAKNTGMGVNLSSV